MRAHLINFEEDELEKVRDLFPGIELTDINPDITLNKNTLAFKDPFSLAVDFLTYAAQYNHQEYVQGIEDPIL